jgi:hypothetical protein
MRLHVHHLNDGKRNKGKRRKEEKGRKSGGKGSMKKEKILKLFEQVKEKHFPNLEATLQILPEEGFLEACKAEGVTCSKGDVIFGFSVLSKHIVVLNESYIRKQPKVLVQELTIHELCHIAAQAGHSDEWNRMMARIALREQEAGNHVLYFVILGKLLQTRAERVKDDKNAPVDSQDGAGADSSDKVGYKPPSRR